jgi:hypothetical protein
MKDFTVELTKREKLLEVNNDMCHNFYYLQYGRIYNANKTRFRRFKFVEWFDIFDVMEYFDKEFVTKQEINEFANEIGWSMCEMFQSYIKSYDNCQIFYNMCNETIDRYNK